MNAEPTKRQRAVLRVIERGCAAGEPFSYREIGRELGIANVNAVYKHVRALRKKKLLCSSSRKSRSLRPLTGRSAAPNLVVHVPLYGSIPAGLGENREQEVDGYVAVDVEAVGFKPTPNTFALRVTGDSMIGKHIVQGDIVLVEHGVEPQPGQTVAALIDGKSSLKTFMQKNGKPYLKAENPAYPKLVPVEQLMIQGVFRALIRRVDNAKKA